MSTSTEDSQAKRRSDADDENSRRWLAKTPTERTWQIPAQANHGPVTMTVRLPEVMVTDSEGRFIVITPNQASLVGCRLDNIHDWLNSDEPDDEPHIDHY